MLSWTSRRPLTRPNTLPSVTRCLQKGVLEQHVAILHSLLAQSSMLFKLSHLRAARDVKAHRGVSQGPLGSPLVFTTLVDEILGSAQGSGWSFDHHLMTCLACAYDVLLFADSLENLMLMFNGSRASFECAGLVVSAEKTHGSSSVVLDEVTMRAGEHDVLWGAHFDVSWV